MSTPIATPVFTSEVKMYYFNPNTYGAQYFVAARSREEAIERVKAFCIAEAIENDRSCWPDRASPDREKEIAKEIVREIDSYDEQIGRFGNARNPQIEEHAIGSVVHTEIS